MKLKFASLRERPDLESSLWSDELLSAWPEFMLHDPTANLYFGAGRLERWHDFVILAFDKANPEVVLARGFSVPFCLGEAFRRPELPNGGWDAVLRWADQDHLMRREPNAVSALEITLRPEVAGQGLSGQMVAAMRANAKRLGFSDLYAPVRPSQKHLEPHIPMAEYAQRSRADGLPHDAWLRVHVRAGGKIVKVAPYSMTIAGTLEDWRSWSGLPFDQSGDLIVPGALVPVHVSLEQNHAVYVEPNVWVQHALG